MTFQDYNLVEHQTVMETVLSGQLGYVGFWSAFRRHDDRAEALCRARDAAR
ncbi:MAG: hypothetical protein IH994_09060 [Proteobacteria bacterium]|nr:hypothetical protein [Pseudomonadota bacterium]